MSLAICAKPLRAPPGPVEGEHSLGVKALVERMLGDQCLEPAGHLVVAPGGELGVDRELERAHMKLLEAPDLGRRERLGGDVGEWCTAPELERLGGRAVDDPLIRVAARALDKLLKARRVNRVAGQLELVAPAVGDDARAAVVAGQRLAQLRDIELDVLGGARRRALGPEAIDQLVGADRAVGAQREHREHPALLASAEW